RRTGRNASEGVPGAFSIAADTSVTPSCSSVTRKSSTSRRLSLSLDDPVLSSLMMFDVDMCDLQMSGWDVVASRLAPWTDRRVYGGPRRALVCGANRGGGRSRMCGCDRASGSCRSECPALAAPQVGQFGPPV